MPVKPANPSLEHAIWLQEQKAAFIYLPKVACTSWKIYLWQALGQPLPAEFNYRDVHNRDVLKLPYVAGMPADMQVEFQGGIESGSIALFGVVREPRGRILSAYLDKIKHHSNPNSYFSTAVIPSIQQFAGLAPTERPSFRTFLEWIANHKDPGALNDHWRPMTSLLGSTDPRAYTQLWTMDHMESAIESMADLLHCQLPFPSRQQLGNRQTYDSESRTHDYYGPTEITLFEQTYRHDSDLYRSINQPRAF